MYGKTQLTFYGSPSDDVIVFHHPSAPCKKYQIAEEDYMQDLWSQTSRTLALLLTLFIGSVGAQDTATVLQTQDPYYTQAQETLKQMLAIEPNTNQAKNVIIFIADGADPVVHTSARIFDGQQKGMSGEENVLSFETFPNVALVKTYNVDAQVPDSAGTATAWNTGVKTDSGVLGVDADVVFDDCASQKGNEVTTLFELAEAAGLSTGTVSTARITHATPGGNYAHAASRDWESDADLPEEAVQNGCTDIATQLVDFPYGDGIEVALGGGRSAFIPETMADPEDEDRTGERLDGRDLTQDWLGKMNSAYVWNQEQFDAVDPASTDHLLGLFERSHLEYEPDRADDTAGEPSLTDMTMKAIDILSKNENGYVLQVESGRVDHALHEGNAFRALSEEAEYSRAIQATLDRVNLAETLIIVTSDHGHVMTFAGYPTRGNPILGLVREFDINGELALAADDKPYTTLGFMNGPGSIYYTEDGYTTRIADRPDLSDVDTQDRDFLQPSLVALESETHGGSDVAAYAIGPRSYLVRGVVEQSYLFHVMDYALNLTERAQD
jgi:alkaline phosphatase